MFTCKHVHIESYVYLRRSASNQVRQADGSEVYEGTQMGIYDDNPVKAAVP